MARVRTKQYEKLGISAERLTELRAVALQYEQMQREERRMRCDGVGMGRGRGDPTGEAAVELAVRSRRAKIRAIENSARDAAEEIYPWLLKCVTTRISLKEVGAPCGDKQLRQAVKRFFVLLDRQLP